ncbi:Helicase required for RNAi-mediated heterochromatin assembly 1 [Cladophialophora carrionii]|uniref:Helicase required for RNAi-mediated heterochromatin assembly 1 n=1 Tax=Cladophialophora carrionii TaxID=86049 RepID=A0A1C1CPC5_9EURO|nr:Helicase required for RNAi-mediated heterochromatin assembly 1 [Cladophialophora carrionii]
MLRPRGMHLLTASLEMNADLSERFKGPSHRPNTQTAVTSAPEDELDLTLNLDIRDYVSKQEQIESTSDRDGWLSQPEIPTNKELFADSADLLPNKIDGPYKTKDRYLKTHYELVREDAVGCFRDAIHDFRKDPSTGDTHKFSVYDQVHIVGFTFARRGLAARIRFSTRRAGKRIKWQNSKRLVSGSIVALLPAKTKLIDLNDLVVTIVAARPLQGVTCEPPEIDIHFGRPEDIQLDPQKEWLMIEAKQGYFEAYRHTLRALQKLSQEKFPLSDHICHLEPSDEPPAYLQKDPVLDISAAATDPAQKKEFQKVDVTKDWPATPSNSLDSTQWDALKEILTKRHPIVQGPPGTGKTYVSRVAVEIMHANRKLDDAPIIIAAQTNHALDQLLGHISLFEPNYIRLGGRSTKPEVKKRALFEIRQGERIRPIPGGLFGKSNTLLTKQTKGLIELLEPFVMPGPDPWSTDQISGPKMLQKLGVLTAQQAKSLEDGATQWVSANTALNAPIRLWLGKSLVPFEVNYVQENYGFEEGDDDDLEFEQLRENEDSTGVNDEEDIEMLKGPWRELRDKFTVPEPSTADLSRAAKLLDTVTDMWKIPDYYRAHVYHAMQSQAKAKITSRFREDAKVYNKLVKDNLVGKWEQDVVYLRRASIIGMTTTGLSKYRPLISALKPKVILIEEAAEVLEAPVTVACTEKLEHLILVGDHQQLQGHCSVQELENEPFYLNVSLFERLVRNKMPYKTLLQQRRMMPEFCRLVAPLYPGLTNHPSVVNRRLETWGTGEVRSFFFDHPWWEAKDESLSVINPEEAKFIAGFYRYLFRNGIDPSRITVLTFYNGQRKRILRELKEFPQFRTYVNVKTVDSYQGEENDIVILSLARNNQEGKIGFLENVNRSCVALSRAKYGFYLFGNSNILMRNSFLWQNVITLMDSKPRRRGEELPVMCKRHNITTLMSYPEDWEKTDGGCAQPLCGKLWKYLALWSWMLKQVRGAMLLPL